MSAVDKVVSRLDGARKTGPSEWIAKCPAHDDRTPSLTVAEGDDGRVLVHCFTGCGAADVMAAIGLSVSDLFDAPLDNRKGVIRHPYSPGAVLKAISHEAMIVVMVGRDMIDGKEVSAEDRERMIKAVARIDEAMRYA